MDTSKLEEILKSHEGDEQFIYQDSLGFYTIGIGRCVDRRKGKGISPNESLYLLRNDIEDCKHELSSFSWYTMQDDVRKCALIELVFNMGIYGVCAFKKMISALDAKDYEVASHELLDSKWAVQVGSNRSNNIARRIKYGTYE